MKLTVVIAEDEEPALLKLRRLLQEIPQVSIVGEARDGKTALELLRERRPDAVFLDIKMPEADGLAVAQALPCPPKIVFVTAHANFAASAFACQAADYLLKPYSAERLQAVVARLRQQIRLERMAEWMREGQQVAAEVDQHGARRLALKMGPEIAFVPARAIECILAEGNYLHVLTAQRKYFVRGVLGAVERALGDCAFFRTHRSCALNLEHVASLSSDTHAAITTSGYRVAVSRSRLAALVEALKQRHSPLIGER